MIQRRVVSVCIAMALVLAAGGLVWPAPAHPAAEHAAPATGALPTGPGPGGATQEIVVSAPSYASQAGTLTAYQYSGGFWRVAYGPFRAELGYNGLSDNRSEGDGTTPTGTFGFGGTMYGLGAPVTTRYAYHHLVCGDWWSGVHDATYNQFVSLPCGQTLPGANSEALWKQTTAYQHFAVTQFNMNPTVIGRGVAIFLHDNTTTGHTAGCIALAPSELDSVLGWLDPAQSPVISIGTASHVGSPSPLVTPAMAGPVLHFGDAGDYGSLNGQNLNKPIVGIAATPTGHGYWLVASDGGIFPFGDAGGYGSTGAMHLNQPIVGMAASPTGRGYWLVAADGGIFPFGDAGGFGSTGGIRLNKPVVGMAATPSGHGYLLVASDGGIFPFGDAGGYGSTGGIQLNKPIVGMAPSPTGRGYWLVAADGGIFPFGDAGGFGSTGGIRLNKPVVGMAATPSGHGYLLVASDGGIFPFGDAGGYGSTGGIRLNKPVVGMAERPQGVGTGWWPRTAGSSRSAMPAASVAPARSTSTSRSSVWPPPTTEVATGSSPPTAGSSPSATPVDSGQAAAHSFHDRSSVWPLLLIAAATGWDRSPNSRSLLEGEASSSPEE